jgi:hypothetical protein
MIRRRHPPSQSWRTFLRNHGEVIAAIEFCLVPTVSFDRLFAFVVIGHRPWSRRRRVVAKAEWTRGEANLRFDLDTEAVFGDSYILEVQSFMNLVRVAPVIFCSLACFVQSAVICFFIFASSAFLCFAAALSVALVAGVVVAGVEVWAKVMPLRVLASAAALSASAMRDMSISGCCEFFSLLPSPFDPERLVNVECGDRTPRIECDHALNLPHRANPA